MYPNLYFAFKDLLGTDWKGLRFINSFGFFVAIAFMVAGYFLVSELKRKERNGQLQATEEKITVGQPATIGDLLLNFFLGFLLGFKFIGLFLASEEQAADPQQFIFSKEGNWAAGLILAVFFAGLKWWEKNKRKLSKPEVRAIRIWPHDRIGDIVIISALFGFLGAKIFHNLENWDEFWKSPVEALLSFSGLTFYGGLICATAALIFYSRKHKIGFKHLCDAAAPALLIAYSIGRIGCQVSGDGDWGILNSAYISTSDGKVVEADTSQFRLNLEMNRSFYSSEFNVLEVSKVPHVSVKAPSWLPVWMVAFNYPHNVLSHGAPIRGCMERQYCQQLPSPVFPTPFYETVMALILFLILWSVRKRFVIPGTTFSVYLVLNGIERFLIEKIRVNTTYNIAGFHPTQAELISASMVIVGAGLYFYLTKKGKKA